MKINWELVYVALSSIYVWRLRYKNRSMVTTYYYASFNSSSFFFYTYISKSTISVLFSIFTNLFIVNRNSWLKNMGRNQKHLYKILPLMWLHLKIVSHGLKASTDVHIFESVWYTNVKPHFYFVLFSKLMIF